MKSLSKQKNITLVCFLTVPVVLMLMFVAYPMLKLFQQGFTDWNGSSKTYNYVGLKNYIKIFTDSPETWTSMKNNFIYMFMHILSMPFAIIIASLLCTNLKGNKFFKLIVFMPYILNGVAVAYTFSYFFSPEGGSFNEILRILHMESFIKGWFSDPKIVNFTLAAISLWRSTGFHIILYMAGIQSIPTDYFEAAAIDGANFFDKFKYITIPSITSVLQISLFMHISGSLQTFDLPFVITGGGPVNASNTFTLHTIKAAFTYNQMGYASAMGVVLLIIIMTLVGLQNKVMKRGA